MKDTTEEPVLSRAVAIFMNSLPATAWTLEKRDQFLARVTNVITLNDLSSEDRNLLFKKTKPQQKMEPAIPDSLSPELEAIVTAFLQGPVAKAWSQEQRQEFLDRVIGAETLEDLSPEDQALLTQKSSEEKLQEFQEESKQQPVVFPEEPFQSEDDLEAFLHAHDLVLKSFLQSTYYREHEHDTPFLKGLWLRDIFQKDQSSKEEAAPETPEQPVNTKQVMVAFYPDPDTAQKIALDCDGALAPDDLHITLFILGPADTFPEEALAQVKKVLGDYAQTAAPLHGIVSGIGCFTSVPENSEETPFYASVDIIRLSEWREALRALLPVPIDTTHGFTPHCTLAYISKGTTFPVQTITAAPLLFDTLWLCAGDEKTSFALQGHEEKQDQ